MCENVLAESKTASKVIPDRGAHYAISPPPTFILLASNSSLYASTELAGGEREDSGIDIRFPADITVPPLDGSGKPTIIDLGVRARCRAADGRYLPYWLMPRSSVGKTPLECALGMHLDGNIHGTPLALANIAGLMDKGYQGPVKAAVRNKSTEPWHIRAGDAYFQLVLPDLQPAKVLVVDENHEAFSVTTVRGDGGFGSTGSSGGTK